MENSQLKQLALLDLSILNFSIMRRRLERGCPLRVDSCAAALAHFCAAITRSNNAVEIEVAALDSEASPRQRELRIKSDRLSIKVSDPLWCVEGDCVCVIDCDGAQICI